MKLYASALVATQLPYTWRLPGVECFARQQTMQKPSAYRLEEVPSTRHARICWVRRCLNRTGQTLWMQDDFSAFVPDLCASYRKHGAKNFRRLTEDKCLVTGSMNLWTRVSFCLSTTRYNAFNDPCSIRGTAASQRKQVRLRVFKGVALIRVKFLIGVISKLRRLYFIPVLWLVIKHRWREACSMFAHSRMFSVLVTFFFSLLALSMVAV